MPEGIGQFMASPRTSERTLVISIGVKQQKRHMGNTVSMSEVSPFGRPYVRNDIVYFVIVEPIERASRFPLQGQTLRALRIVNLHDGRRPVANARQVVFTHGSFDMSDQEDPDPSHRQHAKGAVARDPKKLAPAHALRLSSVRRPAGHLPTRPFCFPVSFHDDFSIRLLML